MMKPVVQNFGQAMLCRKCGRGRGGAATLCSKSVEAACPAAEHLHWRCPCGFEWLTWPADNAQGPTGWHDTPIGGA